MPPIHRGSNSHGRESALTKNAMVGKLYDMSMNKCFKKSVMNFRIADTDHSNSISLDEFLKLAENIPVLKGRDKGALVETFKKIDVDSSGGLNIAEFHSFYADLKMSTKTSNVTPYPN